jgi:hypothetical protein
MAEKKSTKPTFTFREPTPEEFKEMYPDATKRKAAQAAIEQAEKREAKKDVKAQAAMNKTESDEKLTSKMTKAELRANQSPKEAKAMLEEKRAVAEKKAEAIKTIKNKAGAGSKLAQGMPAFKAGGALKAPASPGLKKLPTKVRNKMGYMKAGGSVKKCKRDGIAVRGRTKGRMV